MNRIHVDSGEASNALDFLSVKTRVTAAIFTAVGFVEHPHAFDFPRLSFMTSAFGQ
jgi:hypothetical protein